MSNLSLRHLYKVYPNGVKAVNDFSMEIEDKEFIVFVGPSGCGKSTTLRMIAGLEEITAGELYIGDAFSNHVEPKDRDIAMVFQNYALYPHMTVYENLAFGLRLRHIPQAEIHRKVLWAAKILKLEEYLERKPKNLSGGQRQRVSLGRAILRTPKVFLLDEPLSNLDAKLRTEMRAEIAKLHQEIATTFIYVTHDQVEAMTMGNRIVVMSMGYVQQIDTPQNLYHYPENKFVAGFIGTPQMNFFPATLRRVENQIEVRFEGIERTLNVPFEKLLKVRPEYLSGEKTVIVGLRCEHISVDPEVLKRSKCIMQVKISHFEELGNETLIYGDMNLNKNRLEDSNTKIIVKQYGGEHSSKMGDVIEVALDMEKAHFFDAESERTIAPRIPADNVFDIRLKGGQAELLGQHFSLPAAVRGRLREDAEKKAVSMLIPTDALWEGGGDLKATVVREEAVKTSIITHLEYGGRIFFMVGGRTHKVGEILSLGIDFKSVSIYDSGQHELIAPLPKYDIFYGSYFDQSNAKRSVAHLVRYYEERRAEELKALEKECSRELSEVVVQESLLKAAREEYARKKKDIQGNMSYRLGTEELGREGKRKVRQEAEELLKAAKQEYEERIAEYQEKKAAYENMSEGEKQERAALVASIRDRYRQSREHIEARYQELIDQAEKGIANAQQLLSPLEEVNRKDAERKEADARNAYVRRRENRERQLDAAIGKAKAELEAAVGEEKDAASVACREAKRARTDGLAELEAQYNAEVDDITFNAKVFAVYINGCPFVTSQDINRKIVKGLGAQLFISHYRFEVPHDAYIIGERGIPVIVDSVVDYGFEKYVKCRLFDEVIYVKADRDYPAGEQLFVSIGMERSRIYENKFDIRLY